MEMLNTVKTTEVAAVGVLIFFYHFKLYYDLITCSIALKARRGRADARGAAAAANR